MKYENTINAIKILQNNIEFYICSLNASFLNQTCKSTMDKIKHEHDIFQRRLSQYRVRNISFFANRNKAVFPTAIILNCLTKISYDSKNKLLCFDEEPRFFIIDGQHRIAGLSKADKDYPMCVVIMNNLPINMQSELFVTINSEQKAVNPNVRYYLKGKDNVRTPEREAYEIAYKLYVDESSPFYEKIRLTDRMNGSDLLSLSAFCQPICEFIYNPNYYYYLKDYLEDGHNPSNLNIDGNFIAEKNRIMWKFYEQNKMYIVHKMLFNYFNAVKKVYEEIWNDKRSIIRKTTGFNALIILFKDFIEFSKLHNNDFSYKYFVDVFEQNKIASENFFVQRFNYKNGIAGVGRLGSYALYIKLREKMFPNNKLTNHSIGLESFNYLYNEDDEYIL